MLRGAEAMSQVLVFEMVWDNFQLNINGFKFKEPISYEDFNELKSKLLEPFLDETLYRVEEFKASCVHRVSVLRILPNSFEVEGFRPISFVSELPVKAKDQHCLMITIPQSVEEALRLREDDEMLWSEYSENKVTLEIRRK